MGKKLTKKQNNFATAKVLECAAKQVAAKGTEPLEKGSYPFDISVELAGELDVKAGSEAGPDVTVADISAAELLAGMHATCESFGSLVSDAMGWAKKASKEQLKEHKAASNSEILRVAKRRKMTKTTSSPARPGAASSKPTVRGGGSFDTREVKVEVVAP